MPDRPSVFVTRRLPGDALDRLASTVEVDRWQDDLPPPYDELVRRSSGADALICLLTDRIDASFIAKAPRLRVISNVAVGYDNIDAAAATARGIPVGNTPGVLTETTADLAFALMLAAARRIAEADRFVRDGKWKTWDPGLLLGYDMHGATLGVVGFGKIGRAVARRAEGFGMRVLYTSRSDAGDAGHARRVELDELLGESDFVSLNVPLTAETHHLIGEAQLRAMKRTAVLVNTAGARACPRVRRDRRRRTGRGGGGAGAAGRPHPAGAERGDPAAHRQCQPRHARAHGVDGRR
jgi:glyoxylate reductase